jgi:hypothetical protein
VNTAPGKTALKEQQQQQKKTLNQIWGKKKILLEP